MLVLGLDTATPRGSLALAGPGGLVAEARLLERAWHARDLVEQIDRLLAGAGRAPRDLSGIGVVAGPGSFTGVRIGMATAKGLAYSLGIGLATLSTLEAMARAALAVVTEGPPFLSPVIDAGRGEVYSALFRVEGGAIVRVSPDRSCRPEGLARELPEGTVLVGDGLGPILEAAGRDARLGPGLEPGPPLAGAVALWACGTLAGRSGYTPGEAGPNYVRPSDAQVTRRRP